MAAIRTAEIFIWRTAAVLADGARHTEGLALMLAPEVHAALIGWEPVNSRIIAAKFTTKKKDVRLNIIQCYASTKKVMRRKRRKMTFTNNYKQC